MTMTDYERELDPYYDELMQQEREERNWLKPVQWIFDRLQTGQYISANVANEIFDALDNNPETRPELFQAVLQGITGERKGTYEQVVRDRLNVGHSKLFPDAPEGTRRAEMDWADVLGFIGDVMLDPTTYIGVGGIGNFSKTARQAAEEFADDAVRITLRQLADSPDMIRKVTTDKVSQEALERALRVGDTNKGIRKLAGMGNDLGRFIDMTYREARKRALHKTQSELAQETMGRAADLGGLDDIMERVGAGAYEGAGERYSARVLGQEFDGPKPLAQFKNDAWERFSRLFKNTDPGKPSLRNAVWGMFNRGPIGEIKRALGIRNPYQKYLRAQELENGINKSRVAIGDALHTALDDINDLDDAQLKTVRDALAQKEHTSKLAAEATGADGLYAATPESVTTGDDSLDRVVDKVRETLDGWHTKEAEWAEALRENPSDYRDMYLPKVQRFTGSSRPQVRSPRKYTYQESFEREVELQQALWNIDREKAVELVENDITGLGVDLREMLANRAFVHARAESRYNLIEAMKQFGIDLTDTTDPVGQALVRGGRDITQMGLKNIDVPALEGYVFDYDVADVIERAIDTTSGNMNVFQRTMKKFANYWKGIVTATTGFHARNFLSNNVTQFLRHGLRAFDPKSYWQSIAGVHEVISEASRESFVAQLAKNTNSDPGVIQRRINSALEEHIGGYTVRELAQEARQRGVISEATMGFDAPDVLREVKKAQSRKGMSTVRRAIDTVSPKSQPMRTTSRAIGNYIENIPRFQSFLLDFADLAKGGIRDLPENTRAMMGEQFDQMLKSVDAPRLDYAAREAKKWFIDYEDLTDFEQKTLKNVIPFYTWLRRNLSNQINGVFLYPELYSIMPKVEELMTLEDPDFDPSLMPEWLKESGAFPIGRGEDGDYRFFRPDYAHMDLNLLPFAWEEGKLLPTVTGKQLFDEAINATAPWIRRAADLMMDSENAYHFFYKSDLGPTADAPYVMRFFAAKPWMLAVTDGLLKKAGFSEGAHIDQEDGKLRIDSRAAVLMEDFIPVLRQLEYLALLPQTGDNPVADTIENFLSKEWNVEDDYDGMEEFFQQLSYRLGIKITERNLEEEKMRLGRDIYYQARDMLSEARRERPGANQRSLEYRRRQDRSIRRLMGE